MTDTVLLTLIVPASLEETLVDWLFENAPDQGFCSGPVNGHTSRHGPMSLSEQVSGRRRQIRFEVHLGSPEAQAVIDQLRRDFPAASLHYWISSLQGAGKI